MSNLLLFQLFTIEGHKMKIKTMCDCRKDVTRVDLTYHGERRLAFSEFFFIKSTIWENSTFVTYVSILMLSYYTQYDLKHKFGMKSVIYNKIHFI